MRWNWPIKCQIAVGTENADGQIGRLFLLLARGVDILNNIQQAEAFTIGGLNQGNIPNLFVLLPGMEERTNPFLESQLERINFGQEALEKIAAEIYLGLTGKEVPKDQPKPETKKKKKEKK